MSVLERFETYKLVCEGGLNSNNNYIMLSDRFPGQATDLINFEPALYGGYRRINGYADLIPASHPVTSGKILGIFIYDNKVRVFCRENFAATYSLKSADLSGGVWDNEGVTRTSNTSDFFGVRTNQFNFDGTDRVIITDGQTYAGLLDTAMDYYEIDSTNTGASFADAGGDQALDSPPFC